MVLRKLWFLLICFIINLYQQKVKSQQQTSICLPDSRYPIPCSGQKYLLVECSSGLANRLRILAPFMYIASEVYKDTILVFVWDINNECPGHFLDVFEPLQGVHFISSKDKPFYLNNATKVYEKSSLHWNVIFDMYEKHIPNNKFLRRRNKFLREFILHESYFKIIPKPHIWKKIKDFVVQNNVCNGTSVHIRKTDLLGTLSDRQRYRLQTNEIYFKFVDSFPSLPVYVASDNAESQEEFVKRYGATKVLFYEKISTSSQVHISRHQQLLSLFTNNNATTATSTTTLNKLVSVSNNRIDTTSATNNSSSVLPESYRYTSLELTVIDMFIAAHASHYKGTLYSSMSELIATLSYVGIREKNWCPDNE